MKTAPLTRVLGHLRPGPATDPDLLAAFLAGRDPAAFDAIVRRHGPTVLNACRQVLRDEADVEDAFQATFLVLFKSASAIRRECSLRSWLFGVAHRVSVNARCRRAKRDVRERTNEDPPHPTTAPADLSWREAHGILHEELNRLPEKLRLPLLLCHLEGKSRDEAAAELGWSLGRVKGGLERGRLRLRARLAQRGIALSAGLFGTATVSAVPPDWVDSVVSFAGSGNPRPAVSALAKGVLPMSILRIVAPVALALTVVVGALLAAPPPTPDSPPPKKEAAAKDAPKAPVEKLVVTGKVTDADGKPVAKAKLYVPYLKRTPPVTEEDVGTKVIGETAADGTYKVEITAEEPELRKYLLVGAEGLGVGWADLDGAKGPQTADMKLVKDVPVAGRVVDTEGKPVAGAAVRVVLVYVPKDGKLDSFITGWKNDWSDALRLMASHLYIPLDTFHGNGKTDADGKFTLTGLGAERVAQVEIEAKGRGKTSVYVLTRPGLDAGPINTAAVEKIEPRLRIPGQPPTLVGPAASVVVEGTKVIEGTVTDAETGKPMSGVIVTSGSGYNSHVTSTSDKDGKYRLTGLTKNREYLLHTVRRERKGPYLDWSARVPDTDGLAPIRHDIRMTKGIVVTGKMIDRATGKGVAGGLRFAPLPDNTFYGSSPAYKGYSSNRMSETVEKDGTYRVVTIPGTSVLLFQAYGGEEKLNGTPVSPYLFAGPDPDHPKYFGKDDDGTWRFAAAENSLEFLSIANAAKVIDLKPDVPEVKLDLYVERGKTAELKVVDPDGKPLSGAVVAGLTESWPIVYTLAKPTATVYALTPDRPRTLFLVHPEKGLAGTVKVRGDEKEPVTAKLAPTGSVTGRLVDTDGRPIAGVTVGVQFPQSTGSELYRHTKIAQKPVVTDKDGAFKLEGIVPGVNFSFSLSRGREYFSGEPKIGSKQVEPGKTLELGALPVKGRKIGE
jgi:RNA polymerase sigma factor (sigma-70 family)